MIKLRKRISVILLATMILSSFSGCAGIDSEKGYDADTIRIQYATSYGSAVAQVLMSTGTLDDLLPNDVSVEWVNINGGTNARDALAAGKIDIGHFAEPTAISALENDLPFVILSNSILAPAHIYTNRPDIHSIDDIGTGDKIALTSIGSSIHLALMLICKENYGDAARFNNNLVVMQRTDAFASISSSNELACIITVFPYNIRSDETEGLTPILDFMPTVKAYDLGQFVSANSDFYNNNPVLIEAFSKAYQQTVDFINENPEEAANILAEFYGDIDAADIEEQLIAAPPRLEISESSYDKVAELMYEVDIIPNSPKKFAELPNYDNIPRKD